MTAHRWGTAPEFVGPRHELRERLLLDLFLSAGPGPEVLNGGAGQGTLSRRLAELGFGVTSTDVSPEAVELLRERAPEDVLQADLTSLPFEDERFDAAVLGEVLEHIEDDRGALAEVARVLRSQGVLALSVPANPKLHGPSDVWAGHVRRYTRQELLEACSAAGFVFLRSGSSFNDAVMCSCTVASFASVSAFLEESVSCRLAMRHAELIFSIFAPSSVSGSSWAWIAGAKASANAAVSNNRRFFIF